MRKNQKESKKVFWKKLRKIKRKVTVHIYIQKKKGNKAKYKKVKKSKKLKKESFKI